jgi:hypothetical protein
LINRRMAMRNDRADDCGDDRCHRSANGYAARPGVRQNARTMLTNRRRTLSDELSAPIPDSAEQQRLDEAWERKVPWKHRLPGVALPSQNHQCGPIPSIERRAIASCEENPDRTVAHAFAKAYLLTRR